MMTVSMQEKGFTVINHDASDPDVAIQVIQF